MKNNDSSKFLSYICQDSLSFSTKFASFSFTTQSISKLTEKLVLFLQYIQLLSQIFLLNTTIIKHYNDQDSYKGMQVALQVASFFEPGYWISFKDQLPLFKIISVIFLVLMALRYTLFAYICAISLSERTKVNRMLGKIWQFFFMLQGRFLCAFFTSFWVNAAVAFARYEIDYFNITDSAAIIICAILSILEYAFSFFLQIKFCYMLPTKSFLASKNNDLEIWMLFQKFILHLLQVILANTSPKTSLWIVVCLNLGLSLAAKSLFLATLPLYNLKALKYLGGLLATVLTLNITCFFHAAAFKYFDNQEDKMKFIIIIWIILGCFGVRVADLVLKQLFSKLVSTSSFTLSPQLLIHKVILINKIRKSWTLPANDKSKNDWNLLLTQGILTNMKNILGQQHHEFQTKSLQDIQDKNSLNDVFINYIDKLLLNNSKNNFIKLYTSYFYAKKLRFFAYATRFLKDLSSLQANLSASLLRIEIQNTIRSEYKNHQHHIIDIFTYLRGKEQINQLKTKMLSQAGIQAQIYKEVLGETPDLAKIFDDSQKVDRLSSLIEKKMKKYLQDSNEDSQIELYLLFYEYSRKINYSMSFFTNQEKLHLKRIERFQRLWKNYDDDDFTVENVCQERFPVLTLSGQRADAGKILYCSKATEKMIGAEKSKILGSHISFIAPSCIENFLAFAWKAATDRSNLFHHTFLDHLLIYHQDGYLVKTQGTTDIHPFLDQGIYYNVVIDPFGNSNRDYMLIHKNGDIDCASQKLARRLNILIKKDSIVKPHIREVCLELEKVNQAFNIIDSQTRKNLIEKEFTSYEMDLEEAKEIHSQYTNLGKDHFLTPPSPSRKHISYYYNCKLEIMNHGDEYLKIMILEERSHNKSTVETTKASDFNTKKSSRKHFILPTTLHDDDGSEIAQTDFMEFGEDKLSIMLKTIAPLKTPKMSRFSRDTSPHIPITETNLLTYEDLQSPRSLLQTPNCPNPLIFTVSHTNMNPMETGEMSSKRHLFAQNQTERVSSPFKQVHKKQVHLAERSVNESIRSKGSKERRIDVAYRAALDVRFSPKYLRVFNVAFYSVIIVTIVNHILCHYGIDEKVGNLIGKKEVLNNAQLTNFYLIQTAGVFRVLQDTIVQRFTSSELGIFDYPPQAYAYFASPIIRNLNNANQDLIVSTDTLTQKSRNYVFSSNVKIYTNYFDASDQGYMNLTNFEGTNRIVETGLNAMDQTTQDLTSGLESFKFVYRNALNDLLLKNRVVANFFYTSLMEEFEEIEIVTKKVMIATPMFILVVIVALVFITVKQYNREKLNLSSIPKLNNVRLKEILAHIEEFIVIVQVEELVSDEFLNKILDGESQSKKYSSKMNGTKRGNHKSLNDKRITKKYFILLLKTLSLFTLLFATVILHLLINRNSVDFFKKTQMQISFIGWIRGRVYISQIASQELFTAPANAQIENIPLAIWTGQSMQLMQDLRSLLTLNFLPQDGSIDFEIQNIILENGCTESVQATSPGSCQVLEQKGVKTGLMYLLSTLENIFDSKQNLYQQSDKSDQALRDIEARDFEILLAATLILVGQCEVITEILNQQVEKNLAFSDDKRNITTALGMFFVIVLAALIWVLVIRKLKNSFDNFKKVLKIFPADLALSSFILKTFLRNTSEGALDSIKSYI